MIRRLTLICALFVLILTALFTTQRLLAAPTLTSITLTEIADLDSTPTEITHAGDGRLFLVEKNGYIYILDETGSRLPEPFLDIDIRVLGGGEQGLLGMAFHPDYASNGHFFVNYIDNNGDTVIGRYSVSNQPNIAQITETTILTLPQPASNHNSGPIRFGPDGYLYITVGDGGSGGDPWDNSQNGQSLFGKMLRIDVTDVQTYAIPASNPFTQTASIRDEIWAFGLRNPWRFDFDSATGDLWIADVGQKRYEEVNFTPASDTGGLNYGWDCYEGNYLYDSNDEPFNDPGTPSALCDVRTTYAAPIHEYAHLEIAEPFGCSITGGTVYRGNENPAMFGHYFFGDYCINKIWALDRSSGSVVVTDLTVNGGTWNPSTFGKDNKGELYIGFDGQDKVFKISTTDTAPTAVAISTADVKSLSPLLIVLMAVMTLTFGRYALNHRF